MTELANFFRLNEDGTISGNIASIAYNFDIAGEPFSSTKEDAQVYRVFAKSPRGKRVKLSGIWTQSTRAAAITSYSRSVRATAGSMPLSAAFPVSMTRT